MTFNKLKVLFFVGIVFNACLPPDEPDNSLSFNLNNSLHQQIVTWQNSRLADSLIILLQHDIPSVRHNAIKALASVQDTASLDQLADLLMHDHIEQNQLLAAYAIGQLSYIRSSGYLMEAFNPVVDRSIDKELNGLLLEALGKSADRSILELIVSAKHYASADSALWRGRAMSLLRFLNRDIRTLKSDDHAWSILLNPDLPPMARLYAGSYLARIPDYTGVNHTASDVLDILKSEKNPHIKSISAFTLRHFLLDTLADNIWSLYLADPTPEFRINLIRATSRSSPDTFFNLWKSALLYHNLHLSNIASEVIHSNAINLNPDSLYQLLQDNLHWLSWAEIAAAALIASQGDKRQNVNNLVLNKFNETLNLYEKARLINTLGSIPENIFVIMEAALSSQASVIRTTAAEVLINSTKSPQPLRAANRHLADDSILQTLQAVIEHHDPAILSKIATASLNQHFYVNNIPNIEQIFLEARNNTTVPDYVEVYNQLTRAVYGLQGKSDFKALEIKDSRPLDWSEILRLYKFKHVKINTTKGIVTLALNWDNAPLTVVNFLKLINQNFYDNKVFHRVVPNFVIQSGCSRGDGWGSADYTIRSELGPVYYDREGLVGMASLGKDTENTQFFITLMPTPHLDGRYTIFAEVINGFDVVKSIEIGDRIINMEAITAIDPF